MWLIILAMSSLAIGMLAFIWQHRRSNNTVDREALNIRIAKQQLADLKKQHANGKIDDVIFNQAYTELLLSLNEDIHERKYQTDENSVSRPGSRGVVLVITSIFFLATVPVLYYQIGDPLAAKQISGQTVSEQQIQTLEGHNESYEVMAGRLEARLANRPDDARSWYLLGRTYMVMKNYPRAVLALQKVYEMHPDDVEVLISYADAIAMLHDGRVVDKAMSLAKKAQQIKTDEPTAAWLIAMGYEQRG
nr:c-type cytochrome biogenesis protein CcmI [Gammaproteobacteria bacterium]NIR67833.1 c-type cytochrome biogenesis protein CcmI [candidate division Zixibacteria bacterium]NIR95310.1 c-type cytochrome biogenesis protein CcmI [Gammaproteobacteria bacterium]NIS49058.1 c-type cytochrome biogenesis protein CcmI [candidate division Zixibacteria bacterium]NIU17144.1 c-type cytochrome biogenesis protein CcmI [candidate division Zixibacteria bacterium]